MRFIDVDFDPFVLHLARFECVNHSGKEIHECEHQILVDFDGQVFVNVIPLLFDDLGLVRRFRLQSIKVADYMRVDRCSFVYAHAVVLWLKFIQVIFEVEYTLVDFEWVFLDYCIQQYQILLPEFDQILELDYELKLNMRYVNELIPTHDILFEHCHKLWRHFLYLTLDIPLNNLVGVSVVYTFPTNVIWHITHQDRQPLFV